MCASPEPCSRTAPAASPEPSMRTAPADSLLAIAARTVAASKTVLGPLQAERVASLDFQQAGIVAAMEELEESGNPVPLQKLQIEREKLCRQRRAIIKEDPNVAEAFRQSRSWELEKWREEQRTVAELSAIQTDRKRQADEFRALNELRALNEDTTKRRTKLMS